MNRSFGSSTLLDMCVGVAPGRGGNWYDGYARSRVGGIRGSGLDDLVGGIRCVRVMGGMGRVSMLFRAHGPR